MPICVVLVSLNCTNFVFVSGKREGLSITDSADARETAAMVVLPSFRPGQPVRIFPFLE